MYMGNLLVSLQIFINFHISSDCNKEVGSHFDVIIYGNITIFFMYSN